jgi:DNA-binding CsgD family transcriptional regulator
MRGDVREEWLSTAYMRLRQKYSSIGIGLVMPALPILVRMSRHLAVSPPPLNPYEHRIGVMAASGNSNRTIGDSLGVSARAVEYQLTKIYRKLGICGRAELRRTLRRYPAMMSGSGD